MKTHLWPKSEETSLRLRNRMAAIGVILILTATLAACGDDGGGSTSEPPASTTSTATSTTTTQPPETTSTTAGPGEDTFGFVRSFEATGDATLIQIDEAEMLSGDEAVAAAREDGVIGDDEDLPNDYYIRNPDDSTIEFSVSPDVVVTLQACYEDGECVTTVDVDLATWSILLGGEDDPGLDWTWYGQGALPYVLTVANDVIVAVSEVYLP